MLRSIIGIVFSALTLGACLPDPKTDIKEKSQLLEVAAELRTSDGKPAANIKVWIEDQPEAVGQSTGDGLLYLRFSAEDLRKISRQANTTRRLLNLYFEQTDAKGEVTEGLALAALDPKQLGSVSLGSLRLQPMVLRSGLVLGTQRPESNRIPFAQVKVRAGHWTTLTDSEGRFSLSVPSDSYLPLSLSRSGFVETKGLLPSKAFAEDLTFTMYEDLSVDGLLMVPQSFRSVETNSLKVDLAVSTNSLTRWVRIASRPDILQGTDSPEAPWRSLEERLEVPVFAQSSLYFYQFSDQDRTILSPVYSFQVGSP